MTPLQFKRRWTFGRAAVLGGGLLGVAAPAMAGGLASPVLEPVIAPVVISTPDMDWTGFYAGVQYGRFDTDVSGAGVSGSSGDNGGGVHFGYQQDMGQYVVGAELTYDTNDIDLLRLRGKLGYDGGRVMPYLTAGFAKADGTVGGIDFDENGYTYGVGVDFALTQNVIMGLEYTRQSFDDLGGVSGLKADTDALQLKVSYKF